jgi:antitoxin (DNA-binding transcriptional repressor) of toxin-antitoxin stability system
MNSAETATHDSIDLSEFKLHCLEILEQLVAPGIILTKEGRPLAKITPFRASQPSRDHDEVIAEIWERQQARGYQPPTRGEVDAYLQTERDSWDE